jgi:hypothetical protein
VYEVEWTHAAAEDLYAKVRSESVAEELVRVAQQELTSSPAVGDKDGGRLGTRFWRRGLTKQGRKELDAAEGRGEDLDFHEEHAWEYVLVYRQISIGIPKFRVIMVVSAGEVAGGISEIPPMEIVPFD